MISINELKDIAKIKGITNIGYAEKDYLIELILLSISKNTKDELIFKGGTCLYKFYKLNRFSEDIDFSCKKELDFNLLLKKIVYDLSLFGVEAEIRENKKMKDSILVLIRIKGPLYTGTSNTLNLVRVDINLKSNVELPPVLVQYSSLYGDIPASSLLIMNESEILAEKIMAVMTRNKARDVYDLWFLLNKGIECNIDLINKKLDYYKMHWDIKAFEKSINHKKNIWAVELKQLTSNFLEFNSTKKFILSKLKLFNK